MSPTTMVNIDTTYYSLRFAATKQRQYEQGGHAVAAGGGDEQRREACALLDGGAARRRYQVASRIGTVDQADRHRAHSGPATFHCEGIIERHTQVEQARAQHQRRAGDNYPWRETRQQQEWD